MDELEQTYNALRCLQLYVQLVNILNRNLIFTWKLVGVGVSIIAGYAAIAHFKDHLVFGLMYYVIFFDTSLSYILIYGKAFKTPALFKQAVHFALEIVGAEQDRKILKAIKLKVLARQLRSIPEMGIKVGEFHTLERTSTPVFVDYVVKNIASMLVAFG